MNRPLAVPDRTTPLLARRSRQFRAEIKRAFAGDEKAIHQLRVAARRLRAVLPLLADKPAGRHVRRTRKLLRRLTRAFGRSRDLDVGLPLLQARVRELGSSRELRVLVSCMQRARARAQRQTKRALADFDLDDLRRELGTLADAVIQDDDALKRLRTERARRARKLLARLSATGLHSPTGAGEPVAASDGVAIDAEALHRIRIRARRLRYVAEMLDSLRAHKTLAPKLFKQLQDELGQVHDAHVLAGWLRAQAGAFEARDERATAAQARALARHFTHRAQQLHREFMTTAPSTRVRRALAIMRANEARSANGAT